MASAAVERNKTHKDIAAYIKREFDKRYPTSGKATDGVYQCLVGSDFGGGCPADCCMLWLPPSVVTVFLGVQRL